MDKKDLIDLRKRIDNIVSRYQDIIGQESEVLERKYTIDSVSKIENVLENLNNSDKLLHIGFIGRVKAGKSSLLNGLFFNGQEVLPKAATPMTAALTIISYGEEISANIEFFSKEDIQDIKANYIKYENEFEKLIQQKFAEFKRTHKEKSDGEIKEKAINHAKREMKDKFELESAHDQYNRIKSSNIDISDLGDKKVIEVETVDELRDIILEYVSVNGKYMPFVKSVTLTLPNDDLKDIQIIDTPGLNDPVESREERTRELLKYCDVIFIVSSSGQFLSKEDLDLMDRITTKEGVRELYVVASQIDNQLFGSEKEIAKGDLYKALDNITYTLSNHMNSILLRFKIDHPEVGDTFDQLIENSKEKIIYSSGLCWTLKNLYNSKEKWDDGVKKVWENLTYNYPDYFSDKEEELSIINLNRLANIEELKKIIKEIKFKKEEIIERRKQEFIESKLNMLRQYKEELVLFVKNRLEQIKNMHLEDFNKKKENVRSYNKAYSAINEEYLNLIEDTINDISNKLNHKLEDQFKQLKEEVKQSEGTESESYKVKKPGFFAGAARFFGLGGYETCTRYYKTVMAGTVYRNLENFISEVESIISIEAKNLRNELKTICYTNLLKTIRNNINDEFLDVGLIKSSIRIVLENIKYPEIEYSNSIPKNLKKYGVLKEYEAEEFLSDIISYINNFKKTINRDIENYNNIMENKLKKIDVVSEILKRYKEEIDILENQVKDKQIFIEKFNRLLADIGGIQ